MDQIKVSVIIPVYNAKKYLGQCLDSVVFQSMKEIEIICINDGSTDDSLNILREYQEKDERIRIIDQKNRGSGPSRNLGISSAKGDFISFMDADDYYPHLDVLKLLYEKAIEKQAYICGGSLLVDKDGVTSKSDQERSHFEQEDWIDFRSFQWDYEFYRYIYQRKFLMENGLVFPELRRYQDPPFLLDAMIDAERFFAIKDFSYCYRVRRENYDSWSFEKTNDLAKGILLCLEKARDNDLKEVLKNNIKRVNRDYRYVFVSSLKKGSEELLDLLSKINEYSEECIDPLRIIKEEKKKSNKTEINKKTFLNIYKSIRENGIKYTLDRILFHLNLKKDNDPERTISKM
ncbi:MAG: glycosyltransferase [Erysipelotrichaceae bacterium]|nr:glycosyltransferase [Erysipelotrichaceae bacterium]